MKKTIIISGGTKGIGRAVVLKYLSEGYQVITCSRNQGNLDQLFIDCNQNEQLKLFKADLSKKEKVPDFIIFIKKHCSSVDVLINNTGVFIPGEIHKEEDGVFEQQMNTNLYSAYYLTRGVLPLMFNTKGSHIFNICSTASIMPYANGGSYCISKYALLGMTKCLREELKDKDIRVTAVMPGATFTSSWEGVEIPEERFMPVNDVAESIWGANNMSNRTVIEEILMRPQFGDL